MKGRALLYLSVLLWTGGGPATAASVEPADELSARLSSLESSTDAGAWYRLAVDARVAGALELASRALAEAARHELSPPRLALERARLWVARGAGDEAVEELRRLAGSGFSAVGVIVDDPVLSSLAGDPQYDELVARLSAKAYPCEHDEKFREFDFWIGEWEVHTADGRLAGHNVIEPAQHGCLLVESWTSAVHGSGLSVNFLDHATGEWVQVWMDDGGGQINIRGGMTEDGMRLEGHIQQADGSKAPFRGLWTPLPDGRVRQYFEQSADDGETWDAWFEGYYRRIGEESLTSETGGEAAKH